MIPLQHKLTGPAIAAALELHLPARRNEAALGTAMSGRGRNRPACFDGARCSSFRRPQQQQGASRLARGEAEPLALFKIERSRKKARGHLGRARMQGFLDRPQGIDVIARFDPKIVRMADAGEKPED